MFIRIKNASQADKKTALVPYSKFKQEIAKTLERAGLVGKVERRGKRIKMLDIPLLSRGKESVVREVDLLSKPSRRIYASWREIRGIQRGGIIILSTSKGVLTDREARVQKIGGMLIARIKS